MTKLAILFNLEIKGKGTNHMLFGSRRMDLLEIFEIKVNMAYS